MVGPSSQTRAGSRTVRASRTLGDSKASRRGDSRTLASRTLGGASVVKTKHSPAEQGPTAIVVRDVAGHDVTPRSLNSAASEKVRSIPTGAAELDPLASFADSHQTSESQGSRAVERPSLSMGSDGSETMGSSKEEPAGESEAAAKTKPREEPPNQGAADSAVPSASLTEEELNEPVVIELRETDTFWLLEEPGSCISVDSPLVEEVTERNAEYERLLKARSDMADMYVERAAQTFAGDSKVKEVQTPASVRVEAGTQANAWDIHDALEDTAEDADKGDAAVIAAAAAAAAATGVVGTQTAGNVLGSSSGEGSVSVSGLAAQSSSGVDSSTGVSAAAESPAAEGGCQQEEDDGAASDASLKSLRNLQSTLRVAERVVSQNSYHQAHLAYRNIMQESSATSKPGLAHLWGFQCEMSAGRNVSCVEWNPGKPDMLAVAYGEFDFEAQRDGLILFWSLKNPMYPDKMISVKCGVTCIAFSPAHPNLLAAGLYDGTVCVYDVRKGDGKPMIESGHTNGKHTDPVWTLKWVDQGAERGGEVLVSISTDGRVTQWNMKKGLEHNDLMMLKRITATTKHAAGEAKGGAGLVAGSEGIISRRSAGLCFDFCPKDPNVYVAGTEDGHLHKCSCSYSEQYLESFFGHAGPVYKVRWSPFDPNAFVSCSADWTIKLWNQDLSTAVFSFQSSTDYVADVCWSPHSSTIFASVSGDGRIDVWDLSANTLDPVTSATSAHKLSCVSFARSSPVLVTGNDKGAVDVYQLTGSLAQPLDRTAAEQLAVLEKITSTVHNNAAS